MNNTSWIAALVIGWALFFTSPLLFAQVNPQSTSLLCGTADLPKAQAQLLIQQANAALQRQMATNAPFTGIAYVPLRPHIIRRSDGTGGFDLASLNQAMALTNSYFLINGLGIQFYFSGSSPDYIDDDGQYNGFEGNVPANHSDNNAMNQYYANQFSGWLANFGGVASFPSDNPQSTYSYVLARPGDNVDWLGGFLFPHELGHNFSLYHTFGFGSGETPTRELVTRGQGANCDTEGDFICDTPADPLGIPGAKTIYVDGCNRYDPNSTARDANGDPYAPSISNIMSYYSACTHDFTPGQNDRMQAGLALRESHTSYTLNAPATNVTAVSNLAAIFNGTTILLSWQDNADNEMGYFIERSTSATTGFVPIGGVAPNVTTFSDTKNANRTTYYYRIRPSNTISGSLSPIVNVTAGIPPVTGLTTTNVSYTSAQLNWNSLGTGAVYDVQWRSSGSTTWNSIDGLSTTSVFLSTLSTNTAYEWRVKASASDTYSGPVSFMTTCPTPQFYSSSPARTTAYVYWQGYTGQLYTLQWRPAGTPDWLTISNLTNSSYQLTNLAATTPYEWRLASSCPGSTTITNGYSPVQSFTTLPCQPPLATLGLVFAESATISWRYSFNEAGRTTELRYRPVGAANWTTLSNLTGSGITLTGLLFNTSYEWQVKGVCSATDMTAYSTLSTFTTTCRMPTNLSSAATATSAFLKWSANYMPEPGSTYEMQYRLVDSPDWITVIGITGSSHTVTGLPTNSSYQWRVRTSCSAANQSAYTNTEFFTTNCNEPVSLYASLVSSGSAQLNWSQAVDPGTRNELQYRPVGTASWTTVSNIVSTTGTSNDPYPFTTYHVTGLSNTTDYEWQVRKICSATQSSAFSLGQNFTTQCRVPPINMSIQVTSATLYWDRTGIDVRYDLQYRVLGATDWSTFGNLTNTSQLIPNLTGNTSYEARVRTRCSNDIYSDYYSSTFSTASCTIPVSLLISDLSTNSVKLNWNFYPANADTHFEGRYRVAGAVDWIPLPNLTSTFGTGYQVLTGLASNTQYEWQVKTICSSTESSGFSSSATFKTLVLCPDMHTVKEGTWSDPTVWSCGRTPLFSDPVNVKHVVEMPAYYQARAMSVTYDFGKQLLFGLGSTLLFGQ